MSPIALFVLTGIVAPMVSDRIAHPDRYQTKPIPAMSIGPPIWSDLSLKEIQERNKELQSLNERYDKIDAMPHGPERYRAMKQGQKDMKRHFEKTNPK